MAFGGVGKEVIVWDAQHNHEIQRMFTGASVQCVQFSPCGSALAYAGEKRSEGGTRSFARIFSYFRADPIFSQRHCPPPLPLTNLTPN